MEAGAHILHRDDWLVAVLKPSGMVLHRTRGARNVRPLLQVVRDGLGLHLYPVHRLDRATSGIVLFALDANTAAALCRLFREHLVRKTYIAVVRGWPGDTGFIDAPVPQGPGRERVAAQTLYRCLARTELPIPCGRYATSRYALVEVEPRTGRRHQIRRHLKHIGHPIIGDVQYGDGAHNRLIREHFGIRRLLLQALRLEFPHPHTGAPVVVACPAEEEVATRLFVRGQEVAVAEQKNREASGNSG